MHVKLCHTGDRNRPDCYRRVTIYHEYLGVLKNIIDLPVGVENIRDHGVDVMQQWGELSAELAGDDYPIVCVTHKRFIPCRKRDGTCVFSARETDVKTVNDYQNGV